MAVPIEDVFLEAIIVSIKCFLIVIIPSIDYRSGNCPLEGPMEVRKEKESIPLLRIPCLPFLLLITLQEKACLVRNTVLFPTILEQK